MVIYDFAEIVFKLFDLSEFPPFLPAVLFKRTAVDIFFNNAEISRGVYHPAFYFIAWQAEIAKAFDNVIDTDY